MSSRASFGRAFLGVRFDPVAGSRILAARAREEHTMSDSYDEEREDYYSLADEMNDPDVGPWNEADWDERAVASAKRYAEREGLRFPPQTGDFDRLYERDHA